MATLPDLEKQKRELDAKVMKLQAGAISKAGEIADAVKKEVAELKKQSASLARDIEKLRNRGYK